MEYLYDESQDIEGNGLITVNSDLDEMLEVMSLGNHDVQVLIRSIILDYRGFLGTLLLDEMDIRGDKLWTLYEKCSDKDLDKFYRTINVLSCETFTDEEIEFNLLSKESAIPFIDEEVDAEYPNLDDDYMSASDDWFNYIVKTADVVKPRIHKLMKKQKRKVYHK